MESPTRQATIFRIFPGSGSRPSARQIFRRWGSAQVANGSSTPGRFVRPCIVFSFSHRLSALEGGSSIDGE